MSTQPKKKKDPEDNEQDGSYLVTYTRHLERRLRALETEKQLLDAERLRLERELHSLRNELDRLRQPPLISATIIEPMDDGRVIVKSTTGPQFIVNSSSKIVKSDLKPGNRVALNQRTFAIVENLPTSKDQFLRGMEIEDLEARVSVIENWLKKVKLTKLALAQAISKAVDFGVDKVYSEADKNLKGPHY
ncbi:MAG: hypothetical protein ACFFCS_10205, partial [Candidatus Hodarchaeota archaeon]